MFCVRDLTHPTRGTRYPMGDLKVAGVRKICQGKVKLVTGPILTMHEDDDQILMGW